MLIQLAVLGIGVQPFIEMLFRTEEVIDHSPATPLHENCRRVHLNDLPVQDFNRYQIAAVGAGIFDFDRLARLESFVADQQQEVDRSPHIEFVFAPGDNSVIVMPQRPTPDFGVRSKLVA